ncbi:arsenic resistance N-acetyltransferase ArsN2 [Noviherbaspirillum saxi]|uniref:GNAT family N-acetyltransferase n=1 Tax=Noviherbaspirillum saxi TaxID=2320863 RepID=A0A3A3FL84_9BURK|nr:arsenic resistance N-acetyltransferase ArsN2 [Noviherbaspirillum saxi]RJF95491.1 GNAT family N-acetyltransferase [Noviherbaspirillum saxi]
MTPLRLATPDDLPAVLALLKDSGLPYQDVDTNRLNEFLIAAGGQSVLGAVGLERYEDNGLLRSLVVRPESRWTGLGTQLAEAMENHARTTGVRTLYLLTTTATDFFARRGYEVTARSEAPATLQGTTEFSTLCPAQAVCMRRTLI